MAARSGVGAPLREPTTIVARPSAVVISRVMWIVLTAVASVTLLPLVGVWAPWMLVPLMTAAAVIGGGWSAAVWAIAGALLIDLTPPSSSTPGVGIIPALAAALVIARTARAWDDAAWVPAAVGALGAVTAGVVVVAIRVASAGTWSLDIPQFVASGVTTCVLTALIAPPWVRWTRREQERGRA